VRRLRAFVRAHERIVLMVTAKVAENILGEIFQPGQSVKWERELILLLKRRHINVLALNEKIAHV
jgi:hypothetical protein